MYSGEVEHQAQQAYAAERQGPRRPLDPAGDAPRAPAQSVPLLVSPRRYEHFAARCPVRAGTSPRIRKPLRIKEKAMSQQMTAHPNAALYFAMDLGRDAWHLALSDGGKNCRETKVDRADVDVGKSELLAEIARARTRFGLPDTAPVYAVYEAGRDGFWLARWLLTQGVTCHIIDPCSILVERKAKQRKNDAIDARALLDLLVRHVSGERPMKTVQVPPAEAEDTRELGRLLNSLGQTRKALACRVQSLLWNRGIDVSYHTALPTTFDAMRTGDGGPLAAMLRVELDILCGQIEHLDRDICGLEDERLRQIKQPATPTQVKARRYARARGQPAGHRHRLRPRQGHQLRPRGGVRLALRGLRALL